MSEVRLEIEPEQFNDLEQAVLYQGDAIASAIRFIAEADGGRGNAFIGIAQGLFSIAEAIEKHTQYLRERDEGQL